MIKTIIDLLKVDNHFDCHECIDIAKGKYEYTNNIKKMLKQARRKWQKKG